jgi:hypothetical protein
MKRGPDLDIEAIFDDLESDRPAPVVDDPEAPVVPEPEDLSFEDDLDDVVDELNDDEERDRR